PNEEGTTTSSETLPHQRTEGSTTEPSTSTEDSGSTTSGKPTDSTKPTTPADPQGNTHNP
ncbi:MAG: hypothetical protein IIX28_00215, partial [Clostridia bacterium]|nr:hypothetical protein [Clostridia bacterium]